MKKQTIKRTGQYRQIMKQGAWKTNKQAGKCRLTDKHANRHTESLDNQRTGKYTHKLANKQTNNQTGRSQIGKYIQINRSTSLDNQPLTDKYTHTHTSKQTNKQASTDKQIKQNKCSS